MVLTEAPKLDQAQHILSGKVREIYQVDGALLLLATDRISAFDVVMASGVPDKGAILNQMSAFWFDRLSSICPNHVIATSDEDMERWLSDRDISLVSGRATICRKAKTIPIECVVRGYITGSLYKEYLKTGRGTYELDLPEGLVDGDRLPEPIFTPATKAESGHDENISFKQAASAVGIETAMFLRETSLRIFKAASAHAAAAGLILADTKFEFGQLDSGEIIWIDEALTPDSSRYWRTEHWRPGQSQSGYDKQFVRDYLESINFSKQPPGPVLPPDVIDRTRNLYQEAFRLITGQELVRS